MITKFIKTEGEYLNRRKSALNQSIEWFGLIGSKQKSNYNIKDLDKNKRETLLKSMV